MQIFLTKTEKDFEQKDTTQMNQITDKTKRQKKIRKGDFPTLLCCRTEDRFFLRVPILRGTYAGNPLQIE